MKDEKIIYKGNIILIKEFDRIVVDRVLYCPLCNEIINGACVGLYNNSILFPNIIIHKKCFDSDTAYNIIVKLTNSYNEYVLSLEKYKGWYR